MNIDISSKNSWSKRMDRYFLLFWIYTLLSC